MTDNDITDLEALSMLQRSIAALIPVVAHLERTSAREHYEVANSLATLKKSKEALHRRVLIASIGATP